MHSTTLVHQLKLFYCAQLFLSVHSKLKILILIHQVILLRQMLLFLINRKGNRGQGRINHRVICLVSERERNTTLFSSVSSLSFSFRPTYFSSRYQNCSNQKKKKMVVFEFFQFLVHLMHKSFYI